MGKRVEDLGTRELSWTDLSAITRWMNPHESALARATDPESAIWSLDTQLRASTVDLLARLWWIKTRDAGKPSNPMPKPIPRPGFTEQKNTARMRSGDPMTVEEFDRRYAAKVAAQN